MGPKLRKALRNVGGQKFTESYWHQHFYKGSNITRFQYCKKSRDVLLYIRAIQRHTGNVIALELMGHVAGQNSCFVEDTLVMSLQSSSQDSSLEDEKARKEDRPSSSHTSTHSGTIQKKKKLAMTFRRREKHTTTTSGNLVRTPSAGSTCPEHNKRDYSYCKPDPMP